MSLWTPGDATRRTVRSIFCTASSRNSHHSDPGSRSCEQPDEHIARHDAPPKPLPSAAGTYRANPDGVSSPGSTGTRDATAPSATWFTRTRRPHVIVVGNQKGGTGKSTIAIHLIGALLHDGHEVGAIDLDDGQGTLRRNFDNRRLTAARCRKKLPQPHFRRLTRDGHIDGTATDRTKTAELLERLEELIFCNFVVIDTPGGYSTASRLAHSYADTLITPLNDSLVDFASLADFDAETQMVTTSGAYATMIWEQRQKRAQQGGGRIDWVVLRNRVRVPDRCEPRAIDAALDALARRLSFRLVPAIGERAIFHNLYAPGLTLFDFRNHESGAEPDMSHICALQEMRMLMQTTGLTAEQGFPEHRTHTEAGTGATTTETREVLPPPARPVVFAEQPAAVARTRKTICRAQPSASLLTLTGSVRRRQPTTCGRS